MKKSMLSLLMVALMLGFEGHTVVTANSGKEGLARLAAGEAVDLVLTDLSMPGLSGWDVVRAVRAQWPDTRVGLVTASLQREADAREPVDVLLKKPVTLDSLRRAISGVPERREGDFGNAAPATLP